ncbi:MAG TPA: S9 family peptidase [Candidatus Eisenbacteria bacterium]|nr:S9 family peptidase [Candidatus Eisenbacteria bacterium]
MDRVGAPAPSPDGSFVLVPVTSYDVEQNKGRTRLWHVPTDGGPMRALTSADASVSEPRISPDGASVLFTRASGEEKSQVMLLRLDGGEAERLTDLPMGATDPRWFADGTRIAFVSMLLADAPTAAGTKELLEKRAKDPVKAHVTEDRLYRYWDRWLTAGERPHLFVLDLKTRALVDLTPKGTGWFELMEPTGQYDISPDGREIAFVADSSEPPHSTLRWALYTVPTDGSGGVRCLTPPGQAPDPSDAYRPRYSPDGASLLYGIQRDPYFYADRIRLVRLDRKSGVHTVLTESWDRSPSSWEYGPDGTLFLEVEDEGAPRLFAFGKGDAEPRRLTREGSVSGLAAGRDGRLYFTHQTISAPANVAICRADGSDLRPLTRFNETLLNEIALGEVREMIYTGAGGDAVQMYVVLPPGYDASKRWPLLQIIHGGPHGITADSFHFRWNLQAFAAPGYVVAAVNFHGSTSWGQDFAASILGRQADKPYADIERATDLLIEAGIADPARMAIGGGSYGGYMVCWIASQTSRYRCAVNHAGVFDLLAEYGSDVTQGRSKAYGGEPWDDIEAIDRNNPARFTKGLTTPMLIIHGERDYRVPHNQALAVYNIYKAKGAEARLLFFPDENHWILKPKNSLLWNREVHDWFRRHLETRAG